MRETSMNVLGKRPDGELLPATPAVLGSSWTLFVEAMLTVLPVDSKVKSVRPLSWNRLRVTGPL